jgi:hypothetical protein
MSMSKVIFSYICSVLVAGVGCTQQVEQINQGYAEPKTLR